MAMKDLTDLEMMVYHYIRDNDFGNHPWVTKDAARDLGIPEEMLYQALSELTKKIRENVWIYYEDGSLRVVAD
ncbi:MAG: hypothetical protein JW939_02540 [Candidatus Thermoplasmatota archaeon]|nr:hypothetical protein [Candidatus Thermoplasmatota archaeon]